MRLSFDSIEEVREFMKSLKGTRGSKGDTADEAGAQPGNAPAPQMPQPGAQGFPGAGPFAPPAGGAAQGGGFPVAGAPVTPPEVTALINRIDVRIAGAIASGQPAETARQWLSQQCGPDTAAYTLDQLKTSAMPKLSVPVLENIAKLMNA